MKIFLRPNDRVLFQGDSITDAGRDRANPSCAGNGYVAIIKGFLRATRPELNAVVLNTAISGDRSTELLQRWDADCLALKPDVLSIKIGVNDVWRLAGEWNGQKFVPLDEYRQNLATLVSRARDAGIERIALVSPTTITAKADSHLNKLLAEYAQAAQELAQRAGALYVDARTPLLDARASDPQTPWTPDGCHPSVAGHAIIATAWLKAAGLL